MSKLRLVLAALAAGLAAVTLPVHEALHESSALAAACVFGAIVGLACPLMFVRAAWAQIVARALLWSVFVLATLVNLVPFVSGDRMNRDDANLVIMLAASSGFALLLLGQQGLEESQESDFKPIAFRTSMIFSMVLAIADTHAMGWLSYALWGDAAAHRAPTIHAIAVTMFAATSLASIVGLYRNRVWGLLLNTACVTGFAAYMVAAAYSTRGSPIGPIVFIASAAAQLLLLAPVVVAIVRGKAPEPSRRLHRIFRMLPSMVVASLLIADFAFAAFTVR